MELTSEPHDVPKPAAANGRTPRGRHHPALEEKDQEKSRQFTYNEAENVPVALYGKVVDQDGDPLSNVAVDVEILEQYLLPQFEVKETTTNVQKHSGADGRFEITGLKGHTVKITQVTKDGYEPELPQKHYGIYDAQSTSFDNPALLKLWSTNLHTTLSEGKTSFVVVPDGRSYGIDLATGTIREGSEGDLVAWIKRPEHVAWGDRYDWSCGITTPTGGLLESSDSAMFVAPETDYTNRFSYRADSTTNGWGFLTGEKRFYVNLRNGKLYGKIVINLYADYYGKKPGLIQISYAVNPSGSRLLR